MVTKGDEMGANSMKNGEKWMQNGRFCVAKERKNKGAKVFENGRLGSFRVDKYAFRAVLIVSSSLSTTV